MNTESPLSRFSVFEQIKTCARCCGIFAAKCHPCLLFVSTNLLLSIELYNFLVQHNFLVQRLSRSVRRAGGNEKTDG